eukprot:183061-Amphidinium_carterae.1
MTATTARAPPHKLYTDVASNRPLVYLGWRVAPARPGAPAPHAPSGGPASPTNLARLAARLGLT